MAARLAGIGKLSVPMEILTKAGKLTDYERSQLQAHTLYAEKILREFHFDQPIADIVGQVHERADGTGYPRQLKAEKIHPLARILAVCDVYTALTEPRSYREKKASAAAIREMQSELAKYDPEVFAALLAELDATKA
jgi:HD-GYP domain-containing protein (c-di-GMP phosphodiesterase class II)